MRIFITGATGLIGRRIVADRLQREDEIVVLSRRRRTAEEVFGAVGNRIDVVEGDPSQPGNWQEHVNGCDAVINLAGASIAGKRWSNAYKRILYNSRVDSTRNVVNAIAMASSKPATLINGSAIGYYGEAGDSELDETSLPGNDFLAVLCAAWEQEALKATLRVVLLRTGVVFDDNGGALAKMMLPFRFFAGGPIGFGNQWMSWIHWQDLIGLIDCALSTESIAGPLNATSPHPVRNKQLARSIGKAMGRPSFLPTPRFALRIALGEVASAVVASQRVLPSKALKHGFQFRFPEIDSALHDLILRHDSKSPDT